MPAAPIPTTSQPSREPEPGRRRGESDAGEFRDALHQQSLDRLAAILNPSATASLPGAGVALAGATDAPPADVAGLASRELTTQQRQQGIRERGQDAASASAQELQSRSTPRTGVEPAASPAAAEQASPQRSETASSPSEPRVAAAKRAPAASQAGPAPQPAAPANQAVQSTGAAGASAAGASSGVSAASPAVQANRTGSQQNAIQAVNRLGSAATAGSQASTRGTANTSPFGVERIGAKAERALAQPRPGQAAQSKDPTAQVQRGLAQILRQRGGTLTMKLTPNELGEVKIAIRMQQSRVEGTIDTRTVQARDLLRQNIDALKASLEQRGVTVDRLEVRLQGAAESDQRSQHGAEPQSGNARTHADAGGDRHSGSAGGEDRHAGGREGHPGFSQQDADRGATAPDRDDGHGRPVEQAGGWLRLDTTA